MAYLGTKSRWGGAAQQTVVANMIEITYDGKRLGRAQNASSEIQYGTQGVYEIGDIFPQEHVYLRYEGTLTLERAMLSKQSLADLGLAGLGADILSTGTVNIVIKDKINGGRIIAAYLGCTGQNYSLRVEANNIVSETLNMVFLKASTVES